MKRLLCIIPLLTLTASGQIVFSGSGCLSGTIALGATNVAGGGGGGTCPADGSPSSSQETYDVAAIEPGSVWTSAYAGQGNWTNASNRTICKVGFNISLEIGDISTNQYHAEIWTLGATTNLVAVQATSPAIVGTNTWDHTWVYWTFNSAYSYTANSKIAIVLTTAAINNDSKILVWITNTDTFTGQAMNWQTDYVLNGTQAGDCAIKVYWE